MIDIHCHLLHGIDDGPKEIDTSIRLCEMAMENGIEKIIATPHLAKLNDIDAFIELRDFKLDELRKEIKKRDMMIQIYAGAEVFVGDDIFYSGPLNKAAMNGSRYLLIEFDFFGVGFTTVLKYVEEIMKMDLIPIIAHPERYSFFQENYERVDFLLDKGVLLQMNAGSLASMGSREEFDLAFEMALKNAASFIGTDAHSIRNRPNDLLKMLRCFPPNISQRGLNQMLNISPEAVLKNEPISTMDRRPLRKRW
jgi:protein-tyrosine phosphatase